MDILDETFPSHILAEAPPPDRCACPAEYLDHLLDDKPRLFFQALPHVSHRNLAELVMIRRWSRGRNPDRKAFYDIAAHPECDFWIVLAILVRVFPAPASGPAIQELARHMVDLANSGTLRLRYSDTPVVSTRCLTIYAELSAAHPDLQIAPEVAAAAEAHAAWLTRSRQRGQRMAMFDGMPIWAVNQADQD